MKRYMKQVFIRNLQDLINPVTHRITDSVKPTNTTVVSLTGALDDVVTRPAMKKKILVVKPVSRLVQVTGTNKVHPVLVRHDYLHKLQQLDKSIKLDSGQTNVIKLIDLTPLEDYKYMNTRDKVINQGDNTALTLITEVNKELDNTENDIIIVLPIPTISMTADKFKLAVLDNDNDYKYIKDLETYFYIQFVRHCINKPNFLSHIYKENYGRVSIMFQAPTGVLVIPAIINDILAGETKTVKKLSGNYFEGYRPVAKKTNKRVIIKGLYGMPNKLLPPETRELNPEKELDGNTHTLPEDIQAKQKEERAAKKEELANIHAASVLAALDAKEEIKNNKVVKLPPVKLEDRIKADKTYTGARLKRNEKLLAKARKLKALDSDKPMYDVKAGNSKVKPTILKVKADYQDKHMEKDTLHALTKHYVTNLYEKDIQRVFNKITDAGFPITKVVKEVKEDITGSTTIYRIKVNPLKGADSTLVIRMPTVDENGIMKFSGTKYYQKAQKSDRPIVKMSASSVMLASAVGKIPVFRDDRMSNNRDSVLIRRIIKRSEDKNYNLHAVAVPCYDQHAKLPKTISGLSTAFSKIQYKNIVLYLHQKDLHDIKVKKRYLKEVGLKASSELLHVGNMGKANYLLIDFDTDVFYNWDIKNQRLTKLGNIIQLLDLNKALVIDKETGEPNGDVKLVSTVFDTAVVRLLSIRRVPVIFILVHLLGIVDAFKLIGGNLKFIPIKDYTARLRIDNPDDIFIEFEDIAIQVVDPDYYTSLLYSGFIKYTPNSKLLKYEDFKPAGDDNTAVAFLLSNTDIPESYRANSSSFIKEIQLIYDMFIDPVTETILKKINEPTEIIPLILKAVRYLTNDNYPEPMDMDSMLVRGIDRHVMALYKQLYRAIARFRNANQTGKNKLNMGEYDVWAAITSDETLEPISHMNPQDMMKLKSAITYTGAGGRKTATIVGKSRKFMPSDVGIISGSTIDSGKVGVLAHMSASPNIVDAYGITKSIKKATDNPAAASSVVDLMSPGLEFDDPKRANFANIHVSHMTGIKGSVPFVRGGYEPYLARRKSDANMFSIASDGKGKVTKITKNFIEIKYTGKDKPTKYSIMPKTGTAKGKFFSHKITPLVKVGEKVDEATLLGINEKFYTKPKWDKDVTNSEAVLANIALMDNRSTWEDASMISRSLATKLNTNMVKPLYVTTQFDKDLSKVAKLGDELGPLDPLMLITDRIVDTMGLSKEAMDALKAQSTDKPLATYKGKVVDLEVYYNGDKEDMSPSVREQVNIFEKYVNQHRKADGLKPLDCTVPEGYKVKGHIVLKNTVVFIIYLETLEATGPVDKVEYSYNLKSVVSRVYPDNYRLADGSLVEGMMAYQAVMARIVLSPFVLMAGTLLDQYGRKRLVKLYEK